jgi:5-methylcytosine-specific restriction endonuclease McrA
MSTSLAQSFKLTLLIMQKDCIVCGKLILGRIYVATKFCSHGCYSISKLGKSSWNKGKKLSAAHRQALRKKHKKMSDESRKNMCGRTPWNKDKHYLQGEKHWNWKGGITPKNKTIRLSLEYKQWRTAIFERDNYTCQKCGRRGVELNADHIKQFAYFPELRFELSNGVTLCVECHKETPTYKRKLKALNS